MDRRGAGVIPRIFHQIWLGQGPLPDEFVPYVESWRAHHPDWEHHLWTEETLPPDLHPAVYERLRSPAERSDVLRLELLARHGGIYVDTDFECLRPLDPLIADVDLFAAEVKGGRVNNALVGSAAGHPAMVRGLEEVRPIERYGTVDKWGTGPFFVDRLLKDANAHIYERRLFYPTPLEQRDAYAIHHMARSWKDAAGYRKSLYLANKRLASTRAELASTPLAARAHLRYFDARTKLARARSLVADELWPQLDGVLGRLRRRRAAATRVPLVLHHVWLEPGELPEAVVARIESWRLYHPHWEQRLWREDDVPGSLRRFGPEIGDPLRSPAERAELLGLELAALHGGVVVDTQLRCRRPIDGAIAGLDAFAASSAPGVPDAALFGGTAGHAAFIRAIEAAEPYEWYPYEMGRTGRRALECAVDEGIALLPPDRLKRLAARSRDTDSPEERRRLLEQVLVAESRLRDAEALVARRRAS